ncbi:MAG: hypothetical protein WA982_07965 [Rubrobacteraceae bacterium]
MHGGATRFSQGNAGRLFLRLSPHVAITSLVYLLWGLLSNISSAAAYVNVEHGFSLLAALGAIGGLGHLATYAYRNSRQLSYACSVLGDPGSIEVRRSGGILLDNADWPLLVALLFGSFFVLLAGLGGWV